MEGAPTGALRRSRPVRPFPEPEVPPRVASAFARGGRNFQRIRSERAESASLALWEEHARTGRG
jgi:hypothetical protein